MSKRPGGPLAGPKTPTRSVLFPVFSNWQSMQQKAYLLPAIATVVFVVSLFGTIGTTYYFWVLAFFLTAAGYYFIYCLCGKSKPWWLLLGTALATCVIMISPLLSMFIFIFREILPGNPPRGDNANFLAQLVGMFFGAGLMEELLKALPVFALYYIGTQLRSPWRERVGVWEPLDGILLGAASAAGFTFLETMFQYVPQIAAKVAQQHGAGAGYFVGLQLLIPRIIGSVSGHMAYSGYLGYFIGLSVLRPESRWQILGIGYLTASALHALWNSAGTIGVGVHVLVGGVSYVFLTAAILKARQLSPTRAQNFATQVIGAATPARFSLQVAGRTIPLYLGTAVLASEVPGLRPQAGSGPVAEVNSNPNDPAVMGLKNLSSGAWTVTTNGRVNTVNSGQSARLATGMTIDFGSADGKIV